MRAAIILCWLFFATGTSHAQGSIESRESEGNLAQTHVVECVAITSLSSDHTPADMFPAVRKCIDAEQFEKAVELFALASSYARYDMSRVSDRSAHQAAQVLMMNTFGSIEEAKETAFKGAFTATTMDPTRMAAMCTALRGLGHPTYAPQYMIAHGMGAFVGQDTPGGLVQDFDATATWQGILSSYLHCPGA